MISEQKVKKMIDMTEAAGRECIAANGLYGDTLDNASPELISGAIAMAAKEVLLERRRKMESIFPLSSLHLLVSSNVADFLSKLGVKP